MKRLVTAFLLFLMLHASAQPADSTAIKNWTPTQLLEWTGKQALPVLIHFKADWCIVCKRQQPLLDSLSQVNKKELLITSLDLDDNPLIGQYYEIDALPVYMLFSNGKVVWNKVGAIDANELQIVLAVLKKQQQKR